MTWLVTFLSGIIMSTGFISADITGYQDMIQEHIIREGYITWVTSRDRLVYKKWRILGQRFWKYKTINRTDCGWMLVWYGIHIGLLDSRFRYSSWDRIWAWLNSFGIYKLWEHKGYDEIEKWDFIFFDTNWTKHIAVAATWMNWNKLTIVDYIAKLDKRAAERDIRLYRCSWWYKDTRCYTVNGNTYRIYVASNWFADKMKERGVILEETREALEFLHNAQHEKIVEDIFDMYRSDIGLYNIAEDVVYWTEFLRRL